MAGFAKVGGGGGVEDRGVGIPLLMTAALKSGLPGAFAEDAEDAERLPLLLLLRRKVSLIFGTPVTSVVGVVLVVLLLVLLEDSVDGILVIVYVC